MKINCKKAIGTFLVIALLMLCFMLSGCSSKNITTAFLTKQSTGTAVHGIGNVQYNVLNADGGGTEFSLCYYQINEEDSTAVITPLQISSATFGDNFSLVSPVVKPLDTSADFYLRVKFALQGTLALSSGTHSAGDVISFSENEIFSRFPQFSANLKAYDGWFYLTPSSYAATTFNGVEANLQAVNATTFADGVSLFSNNSQQRVLMISTGISNIPYSSISILVNIETCEATSGAVASWLN